MHRSSESVAGLATALAKAQIELVNPEKSLVANIRSERRGEANQSFRYASLSSGLDIIRKTLGQHEIAVMQTTASDTASGMVNLTTLLAHTSGEWISSDWPVCPIAETATPHRMGAALTYARRYALFALVGIAGDDDLDAPDLSFGHGTSGHFESSSKVEHIENPNPNGAATGGPIIRERVKKPERYARQPVLTPDESAELRARLLAEIIDLPSADAATEWATKALVIKNRLTSTDAQAVEKAFSVQMVTIGASEGVVHTSGASASHALVDERLMEPSTNGASAPDTTPLETIGVGNHGGLLAASPRRRDKAHLRYVASKACLVCGREPADPHHLRFAQLRALGRKVSDEFTVPLCRSHHRELHRSSNEGKWWSTFGLDPMATAATLWNETHGVTPSKPVVVAPSIAAPSVIRKRPANEKPVKATQSN